MFELVVEKKDGIRLERGKEVDILVVYCHGKSKGEMEHVRCFLGLGYTFFRLYSNTSTQLSKENSRTSLHETISHV